MILVFGSLNVDLVARVPVISGPGRTVPAPSYEIHFGGKGANQAVGEGPLLIFETVLALLQGTTVLSTIAVRVGIPYPTLIALGEPSPRSYGRAATRSAAQARRGEHPHDTRDNTLWRQVLARARFALLEFRGAGSIGDDRYRFVEEQLGWLDLSATAPRMVEG